MKTGLDLRQFREEVIKKQRQRQYRAALELVREASGLFPNDRFFMKAEVFVLERLGRYQEAAIVAERYLPALRQDRFFQKTYIRILRKLKRTSDLRGFIESILDEVLSSEEREFVEELYNTALSTGDSRLAERIKQLHPEALKDRADLSSYTALKEHFRGIPPADAIQEIEALCLLPEYRENYNLNLFLADLYRKTGRYTDAIRLYEDLLSQKQDLYVKKMLGFTLQKTGEFDRAVSYLKEAFLEDPRDHYVYRSLLSIYQKTGRFKEAEETLQTAIAGHPEAGHLHGLLKKVRKWQNS